MRISDWSSDVCSSDLPPVLSAAPKARCIEGCTCLNAWPSWPGVQTDLYLLVLSAAPRGRHISEGTVRAGTTHGAAPDDGNRFCVALRPPSECALNSLILKELS